MGAPDLRRRLSIFQELWAARKRLGGLSPQTMAQCPVMCDLLGNGDPEVALVELTHKVMELIDSGDDVTAVEAASYSLGLCTYADTHLARLEEFGARHFLDQRETWPKFTVVLTGDIHTDMVKSQTLGAVGAVTMMRSLT